MRLHPELEAIVRARLETGAREYGDASFFRAQSDLLGEARQEVADIPGWVCVAWIASKGLVGHRHFNDWLLDMGERDQRIVEHVNALWELMR